jgi:hypothetical protein
MLNFNSSEALFDSYTETEEVTFAQARRAVRASERLDLAVEREVALFDRLAGEVTITYVRA